MSPGSVSRPWLLAALENGFDVYLGVNRNAPEELEVDLPIKLYNSSTYRNPFDVRSNARALRNLLRILKAEDVGVIHCNSPVGGMIGRLGGVLGRVPLVIYTAHGFHFFKGAPFINRTLYKFAEVAMARLTNVIITMNDEDTESASTFRLRTGGRVYRVPGVGIDVGAIASTEATPKEMRRSLGLPDDSLVAIAVGDLVGRKNYEAMIDAVARTTNKRIHLIICGEGPGRAALAERAAALGVSDRVHFLGHRSDVFSLLRASDIFVHLSSQEGLPRAVMEAMAAGLPLVLSEVRGNKDLVGAGAAALIARGPDADDVARHLDGLCYDASLRESMGLTNRKSSEQYDNSVLTRLAKEIYSEVLSESSA